MLSEAQKALAHDPSNGAALGIIAGAHAILGESDRAREWIERAMLIDPDNTKMKYNFACVLAAYVGDKAQALVLLERALSAGGLTMLKAAEQDTDLDCLREDPQFRQVIARERRRHGLENEISAGAARTAR
jgi:adenylate cyclase